MSVTKKLDTLAQEWFGEFGFATCSDDERDLIVEAVYKDYTDLIYKTTDNINVKQKKL